MSPFSTPWEIKNTLRFSGVEKRNLDIYDLKPPIMTHIELKIFMYYHQGERDWVEWLAKQAYRSVIKFFYLKDTALNHCYFTKTKKQDFCQEKLGVTHISSYSTPWKPQVFLFNIYPGLDFFYMIFWYFFLLLLWSIIRD